MTNHEKIEKRKSEYHEALWDLQQKYKTYHYKNTCSMVGAVGVAPNTEFLTGDLEKVNCPFCMEWLKECK